MWNVLFKKAYEDGCDYFYQCGDDICFKTEGWVNDCIKTLIKNRNIGLTGPINNNSSILTQAFVSRKHMEIFGWFFPKEIKNWCCDDWYNMVYYPKYLYPLKEQPNIPGSDKIHHLIAYSALTVGIGLRKPSNYLLLIFFFSFYRDRFLYLQSRYCSN